jgi:starch synthase
MEKPAIKDESHGNATRSQTKNVRSSPETSSNPATLPTKPEAPISQKKVNKPRKEPASSSTAMAAAKISAERLSPTASGKRPESLSKSRSSSAKINRTDEKNRPGFVSGESMETEASSQNLEQSASTEETVNSALVSDTDTPLTPASATTSEPLENVDRLSSKASDASPAPEAVPDDSKPLEKTEDLPGSESVSLELEQAPPIMISDEPTVQHYVSTIPSMFIVQITPELAPVAKVGGLADVVFGLSNELEIRGNHVEIILPKYDCLRYDHIWGLCETYKDLWVPWYGGAIHCTVYFGFVHGRKCFFIEPHSSDNFFNRGCIYGFNDDVLRFAFFTRAAMEFLWKSGKNPDVIHCHDWQTALAPVFLFEIYKFLGMTHPRVCFTIHNFKHQGVTGAQLLQATGLNRPEYYFHYDRLRDNFNPHALNLMKAGVVYSNFVTTVSPRHASEAKDQGQGFGLEPTLHIHHVKYGGVVNGIDYNVWNPEIDHHIPYRYGVDNIEEKYKNKKALRERLMIADNEKPIVAFVGRLDPQKGLELIRHAIFYTLHRRGQFVLLGSSPDGQINSYFWSLKHQLNDNPDCHIEIGFNEELSHLIYAGADIMLVPSQFEPCGLTQLIAMRYGTVPVVREVGGLADTVFDKDYSHKPLHERNGYVFRDYDYSGLESALGRALSCYYDYPDHFRELMKNAMRYDFSWKNPGQDYLNIYDLIREK